ncbi:hypothetical protein HK098_002594 [Nowakowskiella sp. JEL0407]|nr:hypothetical protein HK098_002594 [Nowakowskiella sp. JEL0407]
MSFRILVSLGFLLYWQLLEDGKRYVASYQSPGGTFYLWDTKTAQIVGNFTNPTSNVQLTNFALCGDGTRVAGTFYGNVLSIWNAVSGQILRTITYGSLVNMVRLNRDGTRIATFDIQDLYVWDGTTGALLNKIRTNDYLVDFAISGDGKRVALPLNVVGRVSVLDAASGAVVRNFTHTTRVVRVFLTYDGLKCISGDSLGAVRLWDVTTGDLIRTFTEQQQSITGLGITKDGKMIAATSSDGLRLWDATSGIELYYFNSPLFSLAMSGDGSTIISHFANYTEFGAYMAGVKILDFDSSTSTATATSTKTNTNSETTKTSSTSSTSKTTTKTATTSSKSTATATTVTTTKASSTSTKSITTMTTTKSTTNPLTSSKTSTLTTTTTRTTTTTARCTSTPLLVNSFNQLNTNDLGGAVGTNGTGSYWIGGGIGAWQPQNNGYLYSNLFIPSAAAANQCRSLPPYTKLQFIMVRSDSAVATAVTIGLDLGCLTREIKTLAIVNVDGAVKNFQVSLQGLNLSSAKRIVLSWTGSVRPTIYLDNIAFAC